MQLWQDGVIALLAAIGLASIFWVLIRSVFFRRTAAHGTLVLICARDDGEGVEQQVRTLTMLRRERGLVNGILLVDCGLNEEGRHLCSIIARRERTVVLCQCDEVTKYIK